MRCKGLAITIAAFAVLLTVEMLVLFTGSIAVDNGSGDFAAVNFGAEAHRGYDTLGDYCVSCHGVDETLDRYPATAMDVANKVCVTCHVAGLARPDPLLVFPYSHSPAGRSGSGDGVDAVRGKVGRDDGFEGANGPQPPTNLRLILNNLGSGISVYQENPDSPFLSGHNSLTCLDCHTAHSSSANQMRTSVGSLSGNMLLRSKPSTDGPLPLQAEPDVVDNWAAQGADWCLDCHESKSSDTGHNHPDYLCLQCHQDSGPDSPLATAQFPHAGQEPNLLAAGVSELCLTCHINGSMP